MNNELKISGIVLSGIAAALILIPIFASNTTIFLTTENGGTPTSCSPANGLVLAQNLTDLCDVTIISPASNQIIQYNGSQWVNVNQASFTNETTTCNNIGSGVILCAGDNVDIKTVSALSGIQITNDSNTVYFANTGVTGLVASTGISINASTGVVTITNTAPDNTICTNVGGGAQVYKDGECNFRTLVGSPDISIIQGTNDITIDFNGTISNESTQCINVGTGTLIIKNSTSGNCYVKTLKAGSGLSIVNGTNDITYTNTSPESTVCTNDGHGAGIVCNGGNVHAKGIASGSGITITQNGTDIIVTSNAINESTVCSGQSGNYNIVASSSSGNCTFKNLVSGTGISLSSNSTHITITNTLPENTVCNNSSNPTGEGLCIDNTITLKKLLAGTGISLSSNGTRITITNTLPEQGCTSAGGTSLLKTASTCDFKGLTAGVGLTLTSNTNDNNYKTNFINGTGILITGSAAQTFKTNFANGTGISITGSTTQTFTNTGVTSLTCTNTDFTCSASTGAITLTGVYQKLCTATATSGDSSITCGSFTATKHLIIYGNWEVQTSTALFGLRFNSNSSSGYEYRTATNGAADVTAGSQAQLGVLQINSNTGRPHYLTFDCINLSATEKSCFGATQEETTGAANASGKVEYAGKWANISQQITSVNLIRISGTGTLTDVSNITVWGFD